ncbi:MAG: hypothetical protein WBM46_03840 [Polyangiales bacterium]
MRAVAIKVSMPLISAPYETGIKKRARLRPVSDAMRSTIEMKIATTPVEPMTIPSHVATNIKRTSKRISLVPPILSKRSPAEAMGLQTHPVLLGPITYLHLGKAGGGAVDPLSLLDDLLDVYVEVLRRPVEQVLVRAR